MRVSVRLIDVCKRFGTSLAVNKLSLDVNHGEFITLLGPSGCGKTTTLKLVAGFLEPDGGQILINDENVSGTPPHRRNLGMVFQSYALFPHLTVFQNIAFGLEMRKLAKPEIDKRVTESLDLIQLQGYGKRYPRELSGGQQQRVALARALVVRPDVLLLDEPLSNLDYQLRQQMRLEIKSIQSRLGVTSIYVTHDQGEALTMSDRIAIMNKGCIVQVGTPVQVYEEPTNKFVAAFIGEANFFEGRVQELDEITTVATSDAVTFSGHWKRCTNGEPLERGARVLISIRPQSILLSKHPTQERNSLHGTVEKAVYVGSMAKYHVRVSENLPLVIVDQQITKGGLALSTGDEVWVQWDPDNALLLSRE